MSQRCVAQLCSCWLLKIQLARLVRVCLVGWKGKQFSSNVLLSPVQMDRWLSLSHLSFIPGQINAWVSAGKTLSCLSCSLTHKLCFGVGPWSPTPLTPVKTCESYGVCAPSLRAAPFHLNSCLITCFYFWFLLFWKKIHLSHDPFIIHLRLWLHSIHMFHSYSEIEWYHSINLIKSSVTYLELVILERC